MTEQDFETIETMKRFGGSFVKNLAECFRTADEINFRKLRATFPDYWNQYAEMARVARHMKKGGPT